MAITAGNWSSATDPFVFATAHAYTGTTYDWTNYYVQLTNGEGFLNGIVSNRDIQEIYWQKDSDSTVSFFAAGIETNGTGGQHSTLEEIGYYDHDVGSTFESYKSDDYFEDDPKTTQISMRGRANGANAYSLYAYTAWSWVRKDPAQIIFSMIAHYVESSFTLKDFLNQSSFQDASDYYDENPASLSCWREVGSSIADQVRS
jgi:hypothetical protein